MSKASWPKIIRDECLDFEWDDKKLWKLKLPVQNMPIKTLAWQFKIPFWRYGKKKYAITPNQVMNNPKKYRHQYQRVMQSNLRYPLDIMKNKKAKWEIMDGLHRLVKANILGQDTVRVRKVPVSKIPEITP